MDGVLADLASAYREIEARLFGPDSVEDDVAETSEANAEQTEANGPSEDGPGRPKGLRYDHDGKTKAAELRALQRKRKIVWHAIQTIENFPATRKPIEENAVRRLHELAARHRWEVFFITQRPDTAGDTVQCQTQRWLVQHGFDLPSVLVVRSEKLAKAVGWTR